MNKSFKDLAIDMIGQVTLVTLICFLEPNLPTALVSCVVFHFVFTHRKISHLKEELQGVLLIMERMTRSEIDKLKITETGKK